MSSDIQEIQILGDWAYLRHCLRVTMTPTGGGDIMRRSGYTLTIFRNTGDGSCKLVRDANLLTRV